MRWWIFASLVLAGCGGPRFHEAPHEVCTDIDMSVTTELWGYTQGCSPGSVMVYSDPREAPVPAKDEDQVECVEIHHCVGLAPLGGAFTGDRWIVVADWADRPDLTLAHEVGHYLGHSHSRDGCDIMFEYITTCIESRWPRS
jgi:hypothetical protein